jgi:hypothetical protein
VPRPDRVRTLRGTAFGWIDARLHRDGWLMRLSTEALAVYVFLVLVADRDGVSFYRRDRIGEALALGDAEVGQGLRELESLDLVAFRPFTPHDRNGFRQVLALPMAGPPPAAQDVARLVIKSSV